ncbi:platelet glycoprotein IX [Patagioenas fasciata]|uniref:platelet glycoprotein IX n=1 Tax=Patagioenas fasciata TaxID=372321 RepID=UPI0032E8A390
MNKTELVTVAGFAMLLLFQPSHAEVCPPPCRCRSLGESKGLHIDCSSRQLREVPALPLHTRRLYLHNNSLSWVAPGALDGLRSLEEVRMSDNPWNCDCHILYLKLWLEDISAASLANVRCASPVSLRMKPLRQLTGNELGICKRFLPIKCLDFFWRDLILIAGVIITLILVAWALKFSKKLVCQISLRQHYSRHCLLGKGASKNHKTQ